VTTPGEQDAAPRSPSHPLSLAARLEEVWFDAARSGARMPGEPALAAALHSSRPAVREALVRLEERGYIHRRKGADTAVNASLLDIPARFDQRLEKSDLIAAMGHQPTIDVLAVDISPLTAAEADEYAVEPGTPVLRITKRWSADGRPVLLARDAVPITTDVDPKAVDPATPLVDQAVALTGERAEWEVVWPRADALDGPAAAHTGRTAGEPVLALDVSGVSPRGTVCYWTAELHLKDAFRYAMVRRAEWR
jgi:GntR family transcriptional regulator